MTVSYVLDVSSSTYLSFTKLLLRWRGSLWKVVWRELVLWLSLHTILGLTYRFVLTTEQREFFEDVASLANKFVHQFPLTFMLGFFVTLVVNRWWDMFINIGWIDDAALRIATCIPGTDDRTRMIRRNCVRYMVLTQAMIFREISEPVRKRFPTIETLITVGLLTEKERAAMDSVISPHSKNYLPIQWAMALIRQVKDDGPILKDLLDKIESFRASVRKLSLYDWVPIPLVYTQVVFLVVRCYFLAALIGRQYIEPSGDRKKALDFRGPIDFYFPILTVVEFIFYVGWMKVAEALLNPFGNDDDDFEVNYMIDRNLQVGLTIVDDAIAQVPPLVKDKFWGQTTPELLYTEETASRPNYPLVGSATEIDVPKNSEVRMVHKNMAFLAVERPDSERRKSDGAVSDRKPPMAGRSKRRFSERLKNGWSPRSGKAFAASSNMSPAAAENGDVAKSIIINVPSKAERKQIYSDWTDASSGSANLNVLSTTPHDDQFNELCTTNSLQAVSDVEEIDEGKQTSSSRLSLDDNK